MSIAIIDTPENVTAKLPLLKSAGVQAIGRYVERENTKSWKAIQPVEYKAIKAASLGMFFIYEYDGLPAGSIVGAADGSWCTEYLPKVFGVPLDGTVDLVYTFDHDYAPPDFGPRIAAATAFRKAAPGFKVWAYAGGGLCNALYKAKVIDARWITCSGGFNGTQEALRDGAYEMHQYACDKHYLGIDTDWNVMREGVPIIGGSVSSIHQQAILQGPPVTAVPAKVLETGTASIWRTEGSETTAWRGHPVAAWNEYVAASRTIAFGTRVKVSHTDDKKVTRSTVVQIVDLGPAEWTHRIIDLMKVAANDIGITNDAGIGEVTIEEVPA